LEEEIEALRGVIEELENKLRGQSEE